jgi:peptidoglycan/LPS O-acetylase OafA/YrhL
MTSHQAHLSHPKYRPDIDGLRAIAVLSVVAFHAFPSWVRGGFIGVDVFFVISGYLISTIIFENLDKGTFSFSEFYSRRIRRIFPALLLVLIACFAFGWFALLADEYKQLGKHIAAGAGFISNFILWNEAGYFDNSAETKPLLHLWSLGIEEQFYIVWPLLLWFAWKRKFNLLTITVVVAVATFILNLKGVKQDMVATFYSTQTRFWELLSGSLLAWFTLYKKDTFTGIKSKSDVWLSCIVYSEKREGDGKTLANVLSFVGLFLFLYGFWRINKELSFPGKWALVPVLGAVLIITAGSKAWVNRTILSNKVAVWFGLISFPLYLWHWPTLSFARIVESEVPSRNIRIAAVVLSIALAWLTYKLVERPLRFGNYSKVKVTALVILMTIVGYVGYNTYERDGLRFRESTQRIELQSNDLINNSIRKTSGWYCDKFTGGYCRYSDEKPSVVVIGDSHAEAIFMNGLKQHYESKGKSIALLGSGGCPPLIDVISKDNKGIDSRNCLKFITENFSRILDDKGVPDVILTSRVPMYISSDGFGDVEKYGEWVLHFRNEEQGARSNEEVYMLGLEKTIDTLTKAGKTITFFHDVPELGFDVRACLDSRPLRISKKSHTCSITRSSFDTRTKNFKDKINNILSKRSSIRVVDLSTALCDNISCYGKINDTILYRDDDHLSIRGSIYVINKLSNELQ